MIVADIIKRVKLGVDRAEYAEDEDAGYLQIVNEAQREICDAYNWSFMHTLLPMYVMWGTDWSVVPGKCLHGRKPITLLSTDYQMEFPVELVTREEFIRRKPQIGSFAQLPQPGNILTAPEQELYAYIGLNELLPIPAPPPAPPARGNVIHFPGVLSTTEQRTFNVDCYDYLQDFYYAHGDPAHLYERNSLTDGFPEMLIAKAKCIALAGVNDPLAADMDALYQSKLRLAKQADSYARASTFKLRM